MNEKENKEPKVSQVSISSGDTLTFPITEKLKLDEKIEKFLQEITRYVS
ncbi:9284_t:CDS:1, partial [Scutellospora calospora]